MATSLTVTVDAVNYVFNQDGGMNVNSVRYLGPGSTMLLPYSLDLRRVYPKKQKGFPGVARLSLKTSKALLLADGTTSPIIMETSLARRADTPIADVMLAYEIHGEMLLNSNLVPFVESLSL